MPFADIKEQVRQRDGFRCTQCDMTQDEHKTLFRHRSLEVHRLVPDGPYSLANCVSLCKRCHGAKSRINNRPRPPRKPHVPKETIRVAHLEPGFTAKLNAAAATLGISRSAYIRYACSRQMLLE